MVRPARGFGKLRARSLWRAAVVLGLLLPCCVAGAAAQHICYEEESEGSLEFELGLEALREQDFVAARESFLAARDHLGLEGTLTVPIASKDISHTRWWGGERKLLRSRRWAYYPGLWVLISHCDWQAATCPEIKLRRGIDSLLRSIAEWNHCPEKDDPCVWPGDAGSGNGYWQQYCDSSDEELTLDLFCEQVEVREQKACADQVEQLFLGLWQVYCGENQDVDRELEVFCSPVETCKRQICKPWAPTNVDQVP